MYIYIQFLKTFYTKSEIVTFVIKIRRSVIRRLIEWDQSRCISIFQKPDMNVSISNRVPWIRDVKCKFYDYVGHKCTIFHLTNFTRPFFRIINNLLQNFEISKHFTSQFTIFILFMYLVYSLLIFEHIVIKLVRIKAEEKLNINHFSCNNWIKSRN